MSRDARIACVLFGIAHRRNLAALPARPLHTDESRWLNRALDLDDVADPLGPTWRDGYLFRG